MKGIVLAGGSGTRLDPLTRVGLGVTLRQVAGLLPAFGADVVRHSRDLVHLDARDLPLFERVQGMDEDLGIRFRYAVQVDSGRVITGDNVSARRRSPRSDARAALRDTHRVTRGDRPSHGLH